MTAPTLWRTCTLVLLGAALPLLLSVLSPVAAQEDGASSSVGPLVSLASSLTTPSSPLVPPFEPGVHVYDQFVPFSAMQVTFRVTLNDTLLQNPSNVELKASWNDDEQFDMQSGQESQELQLDSETGLNTFQLNVVQPGTDDVIYYVSLTRSLLVSHNAALVTFRWVGLDGRAPANQSDLIAEAKPVTTFSSQVFGYALRLAQGVASVRFEAGGDGQAQLSYVTTRTVLGPPLTTLPAGERIELGSSTAAQSAIISVPEGERQRVDVRVVAEDGSTARNYAFVLGNFADKLPPVPTDDNLGQYELGNSTGGDGTGHTNSTGPPNRAAGTTRPKLVVGLATLLATMGAVLAF